MPIGAVNVVADVHQYWSSQELEDQVNRSLGRGIKAASIFLASRVREVLSVPAPRVKKMREVRDAAGLVIGHWVWYEATVPATRGAPPRKLSGHLRRSIAWEASPDGTSARVGTNVIYGRVHELGRDGMGGAHRFLKPTLDANASAVARIIGREAGGASVGGTRTPNGDKGGPVFVPQKGTNP